MRALVVYSVQEHILRRYERVGPRSARLTHYLVHAPNESPDEEDIRIFAAATMPLLDSFKVSGTRVGE